MFDFGFMDYVKIGVAAAVVAAGIGVYVYVKNLESNLAIERANNVVLEQAITEQKAVIVQQKEDVTFIKETARAQALVNEALITENADLQKRFEKGNRDLGRLAAVKTKSIQKIINNGTSNALRCMEIASGSPLTEQEKNATTRSEINSICPASANPSYIP